ncbi:MAG: YbaK/EbsC family protein [Chloroflexi bacterium]|nr:YbaK/EbsC family protein [Chloroflexota bacterium]
MTTVSSESVLRVQQALAAHGITSPVVRLPASARTAAEAAAALGCALAQIAKSLLFGAGVAAEPILVIASGANRVDELRLSQLLLLPVARVDAAFVRRHTGFAIGGVAPLGHPQPLRTFIDADLLRMAPIWAAAGTPYHVVALTAAELVRATGGAVAELAQR